MNWDMLQAAGQTVVAGRQALILGSAPRPVIPPEYSHDWALICVNGSGRVAAQHGLAMPDLTIFSAGALRRSAPANVEMRKVVAGMATKIALARALSNNRLKLMWRSALARRMFRQIDYRYDCFGFVAPDEWTPVIASAIAPQPVDRAHDISNGVFCCLLADYLGAADIHVAGINPHSKGHAYSSLNLPRSHAASDEAILQLLKDKGRLKIYLP